MVQPARGAEFHVPQFGGVASGRPMPAATRPAAPAKPFLGKIAEMLCGILGGGLRAFGNGIKSVTGAGGHVAMSGILGMMGYAGPYGYDPFGPGQSMDPYNQAMPETNSCYQLLETWLRQCSAQPEAFLQILGFVAGAGSSDAPLNTSKKVEVRITLGDSGVTVHNISSNSSVTTKFEDNGMGVDAVGSGAVLDDNAIDHAVSLLEQIATAMQIDPTQYAPQHERPGQRDPFASLRGGPSRPSAPNSNPKSPSDPGAPAPPSKPGMFDNIMSGAGMTPAMGGLVSQTLGPDTYNPWVADGAEPDEFQISGPEKCTRLMNNWLWKCAMSPM